MNEPGGGPARPEGYPFDQIQAAPRGQEEPRFEEGIPFDPEAFRRAAEALGGDREPGPENVLIALAMQLQAMQFNIPKTATNEIQAGLERGDYVFTWREVSPEQAALQGRPRQAEWCVYVMPREAAEEMFGPPKPHTNTPPGMQQPEARSEEDMGEGPSEEAEVPNYQLGPNATGDPMKDRLQIDAYAQGVKREYTWEELREFEDEELITLGTSRDQVEGMAALARQADAPSEGKEMPRGEVPRISDYEEKQ